MGVDDPQDFSGRLANERDRLANSESVHAIDREAITRWLRRKSGTIADSSLSTYPRRLRVATKYMNLTRRFFAANGVTGYRIVESLGATEGTPAAGTADMIVDITTTGTTLKANHLKVLEDGVILKSQAWLFASRVAEWDAAAEQAKAELLSRLRTEGESPSS
jgi:ATP phosphoribosyltransferase